MTMVRTVEQQGDLARLREIRTKLHRVLEITGDLAAFTSCQPQVIDEIQRQIIGAYYAVGNTLSHLGDHTVVEDAGLTMPRQQKRFDYAQGLKIPGE